MEEIEELPPRAFISYTWDNEEHKEKVRNFSDLLREYGVDCIIDQYEISPPEGWTHWAISQVEESDYVLVVYTEMFKSLSNKKNVSVANRDFIWQADLVNNILYQMGRNEGGKFIPVVFNEKDKEFISLQLTQFTSYNLNEEQNPKGFESLYKHILRESNKPSVKLKTKKAYNNICPYRGLAPFREEDFHYFFGREKFTEKLIQEFNEKSLVSVIGPSGSGKSSVVYAGLIPYLQEKENVLAIKFRPGLDPIMSLSYGIVDAISKAEHKNLSNEDRDREASDLITQIISGQESLITITQRLSQKFKRPTIIFVDQFEEVLTISHDKEKAKRFLNDLIDLAKSGNSSKQKKKSEEKEENIFYNKVVLTLRIGFLSVALANPDSAELFTDSAENEAYIKKLILGPMNSEELTASIEKPAIETGLNLEKGLSELIVQAIGQEPGNLPLLEFCLLELWKKQEKINRGVLTIEDYEELGGVKGALVKHADEVYESLSPEDKEKARRVFIQLVQPGSTDAGTTDTRRITPIGEIGESNFSLLKKLADERLIIANKTSSNATNIEVIHDALIREWGVLREWMNDSRAFRLWQDSIYGIFKIWKDEPIDGNLLKGNKLLEGIEWLSVKSDEISKDQKEFIKSSVEFRDREARAKEEAERRKKKLLILIALGSTAFAIFTSVLSWFSYTKMREVEISKLNSEVLILSEYYRKKQDYINSYFNVLKAGFKGFKLADKYNQEKMTILSGLYNFIYNLQDSYVYENPEEHPYAFSREILNIKGHNKEVKVVAYSPNGKILASGSVDKRILIWDSSSGKKINSIELVKTGNVTSLSFSPDGKILGSGFQNGKIILWDIATGKEIKTLKSNNYSINTLVFHPIEENKIITGSNDKTIKIWDIESGSEMLSLKGHSGIVSTVSISPDGKLIASGSDDTIIKIWDAESGRELKKFKKHKEMIRQLRFSPDGETLAASSDDNNITLWNSKTGKLQKVLEGHKEGVFSVVFSPNGKLLASSSADLTIRLWDTYSGKEFTSLLGHTGFINSLAFNFDGETLASGSDDETIRIWKLSEGQKIQNFYDQNKSIFNINFSPDGKFLAISSEGNSIKLLEVKTGKELFTLRGHTLPILGINFSFDNKYLASASADKSVRIWDLNSGKEIKTLLGHRDYVKTVAFSRNSHFIASGSLDNFVKIWDLESGKEIHTLRGH
ncbi:MAG: TIR domain-containing protein, partial [Leptospiraceae bacterium]|nr:TIR domain-containing protein [Leptospiraceae bacterium]